MIYCGIDPGVSGAMAMIYDDGQLVVIPFDKFEYREAVSGLDGLRRNHGESCFCVVERVNAMPGQGVVSMFNFGQNYGWIQGMLDAYEIPYELVTPQRWKKSFGITRDKNTSIEVCKRLFPASDFRRTERSRKDDNNLCEAALLAEYARRLRS